MPTNKKVNVRVRIKDVIYSPSTPANLLSTKALLESGLIWDMKINQIHLQNQKCTIRCDYINGLVVLPVIQPFNFNQSRIETKDVMLASINYSTMHKRMMHAGREQVMKACQEAAITLSNTHDHFCDGCMRAKATDTIPKHAHTVTTITPVQFIRGDVIQHNHPNHLG